MLVNQYFALRHGKSLANEANIIISHPENGIQQYGLSTAGLAETEQKLRPRQLKKFNFNENDSLCITSDFRRSVETAEIFCRQSNLAALQIDARLRERFFGEFEQSNTANYQRVWHLDHQNARQTQFGCESTEAVLSRLLGLIQELEGYCRGKKIVLVSHGDPLQILQTWFAGLPCNAHRQLPHLANAELRSLTANRKSDASLSEHKVAMQEKIIRETNQNRGNNF